MSETTITQLFAEKFGEQIYGYENGGVQIYKRCPNCAGHKLSCNVEQGLFRCYHCQHSGSINIRGAKVEVSEEEKVDRYLQLEVMSTLMSISGLSATHRKYLYRRGIYNPDKYKIFTAPVRAQDRLLEFFTKEELLAAKMAHVHPTKGTLRPERSINMFRIIIPYLEDGYLIAAKSRVDITDLETPAKYRYVVPFGMKIGGRLWCPPQIVGTDLIVTEGEMKAMVSCEAGISACAVSGISSAKSCIPSIQQKMRQNGIKRLFIIMDTDPAAKAKLGSVTSALYIAEAIPNSTVLFLPPDDPEVKMDLDIYINKYGIESVIELMEEAWITKDQARAYWRSQIPELTSRAIMENSDE